MKSILKDLKKIVIILEDKKKLYKLGILLGFITIIDLMSIGLIYPVFIYITKNKPNSSGILGEISKFQNSNNIVLIVILLVVIIKTIIALRLQKNILKYINDTASRLRFRLITSYLNKSEQVNSTNNYSFYVRNINNSVETFSREVLISIAKIIIESISIFVIISYIAVKNRELFIAILLLIIIFAVIYDKTFKERLNQYGDLLNKSIGNVIEIMNELLRGGREIRTYGAEEFFNNKFLKYSNDWANNSRKSEYLSTIPKYIIEFFIVILVLIGFLILDLYNIEIKIIIPYLILYGYCLLRIMQSSSQLVSSLAKYRTSKTVIEDLINIGFSEKKQSEIIGNNNNFQSIELSNVSYEYNKSKKVLKNINLRICKGEIVGIIGDSGAGKSTLVNILIGEINPDSGGILVNSRISKSVGNDLTGLIAYLPQNPLIINENIIKNITLSDYNYGDEYIKNLIKIVGLDEIYSNLDIMNNKKLGDDGSKVSGGEKQKIAIARALHFNRELIILDEFTSSLDADSEDNVIKIFEKFKENKTLIIISHRKQPLRICNKIYQLDKGNIFEVENGTNYSNTN